MGIATKHPFSNGRMPRTRAGKSEVVENKPRPIRPIERQPMKEWLQELLNDNAIPHQLSWLDKNKREFRINWRHGSRHGWSLKDVELYKSWAIHTGRFDEKDQDTKRWKANFRCALNSLSDVKEQKDSGVKKGANAFKVYKFIDHEKDSKASRKRCKQSSSDDEKERKKSKPSSQSEDSAFSPACTSVSSPSYDSTIGSPSTSSMSSSPMSPPSAASRLHMTHPNANPTTVEFGKMISIPLHHCGFVMLKPSDLAGTNQRQRETFDTDSEPASIPSYTEEEEVGEEDEEEEVDDDQIDLDITEVAQNVEVKSEHYHGHLWNSDLQISSSSKNGCTTERENTVYRDVTKNLPHL